MKFIVWIILASAPTLAFAADGPKPSRLTRLYEWSMKPVREFQNYVSTVNQEGAKRAFVKNDEFEPLRKLQWQDVLQPTPKGSVCSKIFSLNSLFQIPSRGLGYLITGTAYDFVPISLLNEALEQWSMKAFKQTRTRLTKPVRNLLMVATFPLTGLGLTLMGIGYQYQSMLPYRSLYFVENFDYRFKDARDLTTEELAELKLHPEDSVEFKMENGLRSLQPDTLALFNINRVIFERTELSKFFSFLQEHQISYSDPMVFGALRGDSASSLQVSQAIVNQMGIDTAEREVKALLYQQKIEATVRLLNESVLKDAHTYTDDNWLARPPESIKFADGATITPAQKNEVYRIQLELLKAKDFIYARQALKNRISRFFGADDIGSDTSSFLQHLNDPFINDTLPKYVSRHQTDVGLLPYHACQYLDWVARLEMFKVLNATLLSYEYQTGPDGKPRSVLTSKALSISEIENEILRDPSDPRSMPNLNRAFREWRQSLD